MMTLKVMPKQSCFEAFKKIMKISMLKCLNACCVVEKV